MLQIRRGVFETNSSSTHSISICKKSDYDAWENGELFLDNTWEHYDEGKFMTEEETLEWFKRNSANIESSIVEECLDVDISKFKTANEYISLMEKFDYDPFDYERPITLQEWFDNTYMETYKETYVTEHGDEIVCWGYYGRD